MTPDSNFPVPAAPNPTIALALGAGGARGCAHIGVIRGLEDLGILPVGVAGGSMGALVGALYALGASAEELARLRLGARIRAAIRLRLSGGGFLDPAPFIDLVHGLVGDKTFTDARFPLAVTAVDLAADERVVLWEGEIASAVVASMMVPGVFPPHFVHGRWLSDPGIIDSVPVDVAGGFGAQTVVAVSADRPSSAGGRLSSRPPVSSLFRGAGQLWEAIGIRTQWPWASQFGCTLMRMSRGGVHHAAPPSVIWVRPAFGSMNANQFGACDRAIKLGEEAVRQAALSMPSAPQTGR